MNNHTPLAHRLWFKYLTAAIAVSIAFGLRFWFLGGIGPAIPYLTFFPAVMLAAVVGGIGPGCLAICLSALLVVHFFIEPVGTYYLYVENHRDAHVLADGGACGDGPSPHQVRPSLSRQR